MPHYQGSLSPIAPVFIFGLTSLLGGVLALILPETNNKTLPNTIQVKMKFIIQQFVMQHGTIFRKVKSSVTSHNSSASGKQKRLSPVTVIDNFTKQQRRTIDL